MLVKRLRCVRLFVTPWTVAFQVPPSMGFFRQKYRSGSPFPSPWDLPNPGIEPGPPSLKADSLLFELPGKVLDFSLVGFKSVPPQIGSMRKTAYACYNQMIISKRWGWTWIQVTEQLETTGSFCGSLPTLIQLMAFHALGTFSLATNTFMQDIQL